jgi:hypothetical protein
MKCRGSGTSTTPRFVLCVCVCVCCIRLHGAVQYTAQVCAILFVVGLLLNRVSGYTFTYIIGNATHHTHTHTRLHLTPMPNTSL